jgi:hypothetical protein
MGSIKAMTFGIQGTVVDYYQPFACISAGDDLSAVPGLLSVLASRAGGLLNYADLSRALGLPQTTLKRYFALLEMTFLVRLLRPWSGNLGQRSIRTPKVYLNDTGLLAHLWP